MPIASLPGAAWRKSSFSNSQAGGDECVEVAFPEGTVAMRDTKDRTRTPHEISRAGWAALLAGVRAGDFDDA